MRYFFITILYLLLQKAYSSESMRRCMILPIKDSVNGVVGYQVFNEIENYLKDSDWCSYQSNSEIINILGNYKNNLDTHLNNKEVLKVLAEKLRAGSLIRITLDRVGGGATVNVQVIGDNGEDVYFKEETRVDNDDIDILIQVIKNWLLAYSKRIPYDGRIIGVLGNQFTIDSGNDRGIFNEDKIQIVRTIKKQKHPLLKEIVEWETVKIGDAKIFHTTDTQAIGNITLYDSNRRLEVNDWAIKKIQSEEVLKQRLDDSDYDGDFGQLGKFGIYGMMGPASESFNTSSSTHGKIGGFTIGIHADTEIWITREWWASVEMGKKFGSFSRKEGSLSSKSNSIDTTSYKIKVGYKYLPMGFFYGPQVDAYIGYAGYNYDLSTRLSDGVTAMSFKGILLGGRGRLPLIKDFSVILAFDFIFNPSFNEDAKIYGKDDGTSNFSLLLGGVYDWSKNINIEGSLGFINNKAKFRATNKEVKFNETNIKLGASFSF